MARMRSIKPEFFADQDLAEELPSRDARLLYIGLWGLADEHGRLRGDARSIKGQLFAYDDDLTPDIIDKLIEMIAESGRAVRYRVGKAIYLFLPKLAEHQRLEPEKTPSRLPGPDDEQAELFKISSSGKFSDESAENAEESALARARLFKHVAGSREHVAGSMRASERGAADEEPPPGNQEPPGQAEQILAEWRATLRAKPQKQIVNALGVIVQAALGQGQHPDHVREALRRWQARTGIGPQVLISIIHEVATGPEIASGPRASPGNVIALRTDASGFTDATSDQRHLRNKELIAQLRAQEGAQA